MSTQDNIIEQLKERLFDEAFPVATDRVVLYAEIADRITAEYVARGKIPYDLISLDLRKLAIEDWINQVTETSAPVLQN